jgi:DNA polymerase family A
LGAAGFYGRRYPQAEAGAYIRAYFERFPAILAYMERTKTDCRRAGNVETIFGRKCFIPGIRDANPMRRAGAERQAINAPLQGSAADIIKRAMSRVPVGFAPPGLKIRMLLRVHDELLFEAPKPRSSTPPRSSTRPWKAPARHTAISPCRTGPRARRSFGPSSRRRCVTWPLRAGLSI